MALEWSNCSCLTTRSWIDQVSIDQPQNREHNSSWLIQDTPNCTLILSPFFKTIWASCTVSSVNYVLIAVLET